MQAASALHPIAMLSQAGVAHPAMRPQAALGSLSGMSLLDTATLQKYMVTAAAQVWRALQQAPADTPAAVWAGMTTHMVPLIVHSACGGFPDYICMMRAGESYPQYSARILASLLQEATWSWQDLEAGVQAEVQAQRAQSGLVVSLTVLRRESGYFAEVEEL